MDMDMDYRLISTNEASEMLNVSPRTVHNLMAENLPYVKLTTKGRGKIMFLVRDVEAFIESRRMFQETETTAAPEY